MRQRNKGKRLNSYMENYVVFDLETTGINPEKDAIIEISAVKVKKHEVVGEFSTLVNPGRHIPAGDCKSTKPVANGVCIRFSNKAAKPSTKKVPCLFNSMI